MRQVNASRTWGVTGAARKCAVACSLLWLAGMGCRRTDPLHHTPAGVTGSSRCETGGADQALDTIACGYLRLALALGERDPDSLDYSIAPAAWNTAAREQYVPLDEIARVATRLRSELTQVVHSLQSQDTAERTRSLERAQALDLQLRAIEARVAMLRGATLPFDEEANALFATTRLPNTRAAERAQLRAQVARLLPKGAGSRGNVSLAQRYAAFDRQFLVRPDRLATVMRAALATCRARTQEHLTLPAGEAVELAFVRHVPWSAFSRYHGGAQSTISLNLDLPITVDDALELACHEGYPGHHVFNTLRDLSLVGTRHRAEAEVQLTFSPQSYVSEAAAAYAPRLAMPLPDRVRVERDVLFPLAGVPTHEAARYVQLSELMRGFSSGEPAIARDYLDGRLEFVRAEQALAAEVLMAHAEASLLYLNEYRSYMLAYTDGPQRVRAYLAADVAEQKRRPAAPAVSEEQMKWNAYVKLMKAFVFDLRDVPVSP